MKTHSLLCSNIFYSIIMKIFLAVTLLIATQIQTAVAHPVPSIDAFPVSNFISTEEESPTRCMYVDEDNDGVFAEFR